MNHPNRQTMQKLEQQNLAQTEKTHSFFTIRDLDGKGYGLPTPALSTAHFLRELESNLTPKHNMIAYADRFEIYETGGYNYITGEIITSEQRLIGVLKDLIRLPENNQTQLNQ